MFWWILLGIGAIVMIVGIILWIVAINSDRYIDDREGIGITMSAIGGVIVVAMLFVCITITLQNKKEMETFIRQKEYIETVAPTLPDTDNFALTQKRIELNEWLYDAQYSKENYPFFSLYPDEVLELEEIK